MVNAGQTGQLSKKTKFLYGIGDVGNAIVNSAVQFFLMIFYTDGALIGPVLAGSALFVGKIWDAVNDPLFGWLSDRTTSRFGKRRVFMLFGAIPLGFSIMLLWFVPSGLGQLGVFLWIALSFVLFDTLWTLTNVPYYSLTTELTEDYDERSSLTAYRMVLAVPAYLVGAALTPAIVGMFEAKRNGYAFIGILYGIIAAVALLIAAAGLREKSKISQSKAETPPFKTFANTLRNRPFVQLIVAYLSINLAFGLVKTLMAYYLTYQANMEAQVPAVMGLMLATVAVFLFPWKMLAARWNKGPAYALGMALGGAAVVITFFLPNEPNPWVYLVGLLAGMGFSAQWVFPWAMVPDAVDYDRLGSGEYRSGMYFGVWGLATKTSEALAIAGTGWILGWFGYVPNVAQSETALLGIRLFFGPIPALLIAAALPLLIWYPITRRSHQVILDKLESQELTGSQIAGPLPAGLGSETVTGGTL